VVEKVCLLQVTNGSLVEETVKLALQLEREDLRTCSVDEHIGSLVADKEATCSASISGDQPNQNYDFQSAWRAIKNEVDENSSKTNEQQEMIKQAVVPEATQQSFEMENGASDLIWSRSTEVTQPAIDADTDDSLSRQAEDGETSTHSREVVGAAKRPLARDLVCCDVIGLQLFY